MNLSWLPQQFKRTHFRLVYVGSTLQAADIFTKPFTNSETWESALRLMGISSQPREEQPKMKACARPRPRNAQGNLLAPLLRLTAGYSLNFVVGLIQSLVTAPEIIPKIVISSDAQKAEMLHLGLIGWKSETNSSRLLNNRRFSHVRS